MTRAQEMVAELNKVMGEGTAMIGSDPRLVVKYLPTGVLPIDVLLQGGIPRGRATEVFGNYSTLKSYIALKAIATTQASGGVCALVDTEHAYDPDWLRMLGGDPDNLILKQPANGEEAVEMIEVLIRSGIDLIVWDSVAATITKNSVEKKATEDVQPARLAAFMSRALPRLTAANTGTTAMLWINQTRVNVGMTFGPTETTPGGKALPFYATYRMRFSKAGQVTEDVKTWDGSKYVSTKQRVGIKIKATLEKSKLNKPDREAWFTFDQRTSQIDDVGFLIAQGMEQGHVTMANGMWKLGNRQKAVRGAEKFRSSITESDITWLMNKLGITASAGAKSPGPRGPVRKKGLRPKPAS